MTLLIVVCLHHFIWNQIHMEMHKPEKRFFSHWSTYKFLARYHYLHHRYPNKNFNVVLPLADYVLGTHIRASTIGLGRNVSIRVSTMTSGRSTLGRRKTPRERARLAAHGAF